MAIPGPTTHNPRMEPQIRYCTASDGESIAEQETKGVGEAVRVYAVRWRQ